MGTEKIKVERYNLNFGTNVIRDCNGTVVFRSEGKDKELFTLEKNANVLLLSTEIRDENGILLAKLRRNSFVYSNEGFDAKKMFLLQRRTPDTFILIRNEDNSELFKAQIMDNTNVLVTGVFYAGKTKIVATDEKLLIGTNRLIGNQIDGFGCGLLLEGGSFALGVTR